MESTTSSLIENAKQKQRAVRLQWYREESVKRLNKLLDLFEELRVDALEPWRAQYATFEECCEAEFGVSASRVRQLRNASSVKAALLSEAPDMAPVVKNLNEGQVRELVSTPKEQRMEVLRIAIRDSGKPTPKAIRQAAIIVTTPEKKDADPECCPHCHRAF
jgi:hypothetical protein